MGSDFLGNLVLQLPHSLLLRELFLDGSDLGEQPHFEAAHGEEEIGVVAGVNRDIGVFPVDGGDAPRQSVLDLPKHRAAQIYVVLHQPHAAVFGPAFPVVVPHHVLVVWIRVFSQISLN